MLQWRNGYGGLGMCLSDVDSIFGVDGGGGSAEEAGDGDDHGGEEESGGDAV